MSTSAETKAQSWPGSTGQLSSGAGTAVTISPSSALSGSTLTIGGWQTTYEVNFTSLTPVASYSTGTATIDGKTWTLGGLGGNATASLSAADGFQISLTANTNGNAYTTIPFNSFGVLPGESQVMLWTRLETTLSTSGGDYSTVDAGFMSSDLQTRFPSLRLGWQQNSFLGAPSGTSWIPWVYANSTNYTNYAGYTQNSLTHDVRVIRYVSSSLAEIWTGAWSSGWPSFSSLTYRGMTSPNLSVWPGGVAGLTIPNPANICFALQVQAAIGTSATTIAKLKALRVQAK